MSKTLFISDGKIGNDTPISSSGIDITYIKSRDVLLISGWYDSCVGITSVEIPLAEFFELLGITCKNRGLKDQQQNTELKSTIQAQSEYLDKLTTQLGDKQYGIKHEGKETTDYNIAEKLMEILDTCPPEIAKGRVVFSCDESIGCNTCNTSRLVTFIEEEKKKQLQNILDGLKLCGVTIENNGDSVFTGVQVPGCLYAPKRGKRKEFIGLIFGEEGLEKFKNLNA